MDRENNEAIARHQPPQRFRPLSEIYSELGHTLFNHKQYAGAVQAFRQAIQAEPQAAILQIHLAQACEELRHFDDALRAYLEAVRLSPRSAPVALTEAHDLLDHKRARVLREWLESAWRPEMNRAELTGEPRAAVHLFLGRVNLYCENFKQASEDFGKALEDKPGDVFGLEGYGEARHREGAPEAALAALQEAVVHSDECDHPDRRATTRFRLARVLMELNRYGEAEPFIRQGLTLDHVSPVKFQVLLGQCLLALGRTEEAIEAADAALKLDHAQSEAHLVRAGTFYALQKYDEAVKSANKALKLAPTHSQAIRIKAHALIEGRLDSDLTQAIRLLQVYVRELPSDTASQRLLIRTLREAQRSPEEISKALNLAISNAPDEERPSLMLELAEAYLGEKRPDEAANALEEGARLDPGLRSDQWWLFYGDALGLAERPEDARESYRKGLELNPAHQVLLERFAEISEKLGDWPRAVESWKKLMEAAPDLGQTRLRLAQAQRHQGDLANALSSVERALEFESEYARKAEGFRLKAELMNSLDRPKDEIAEAYYEAGRRRYWNNEFDSALEMFELAKKMNDRSLPIYWYCADALLVASFTPTPPYVEPRKIQEGLSVWDEGYRIGVEDAGGQVDWLTTGGADFSWAYVSRALINEQLARRDDDRRLTLWWSAIVYLNRAILLNARDAYRWAMLARFHSNLDNDSCALLASRQALDYDTELTAALEERARILVDTGYFTAAADVIDKRMELGESAWMEGVKALVHIYEGKYEAALELLGRQVETSDDIWTRSRRAISYLMLDRPDQAREDYNWIWERHDDPAYKQTDNQEVFAWAAYQLAMLSDQRDLLNNAIAICKRLSQDPMQRVSGSLGIFFLSRGEQDDVEIGGKFLEEAVRQATRPRELAWLLKIVLPLLDRRLGKLGHGEQARATLEKIRPKIEARRNELETSRPRTAEEEAARAEQDLNKAVREPDRRGATDGWAWLGMQAEIARMHAGQKRWGEAAATYQLILHKEADRFPEARIGLETAIDELQKAGDQKLKEGNPVGAVEDFSQAYKFAIESLGDEKKRAADCCCRIGYAQFVLGDSAEARRNFIKSLQLYRERDADGAGKSLGDCFRFLLTGGPSYWALDDELRTLAEAPELDQSLRGDLAAAIRSLADYPDEFYRLSSQSGDALQLLPVVTPIAVEIGAAMIPEDTSEGWPLLKKFIPEMRERIQNEMGVRTPGVRFRGNEGGLPKESYIILLDEVPLVLNSVQMSRRYCPESPERLREAGVSEEVLIEARSPLTGQEGCWIRAEDWELVSRSGLELWEDPLLFMVYHLEALLRRNLADFLGVQEVENLIEGWRATDRGSTLIAAVLPDQTSRLRFAQLLRVLAKEMVPIAQWENILEAVQSVGLAGDDAGEALRSVRLRLKESLPGNAPSAERLELPGEIEEAIGMWVRRDAGKTFLAIPPEETQEILAEIRNLVGSENRNHVLVVGDAEIRPFVRRLVEIEFADLMVISREEMLLRETDMTDMVRYGAFRNE